MYKVTVWELRKPATSEDNEADVVREEIVSSDDEVLAQVRLQLPVLGGTYGRWLEITVTD